MTQGVGKKRANKGPWFWPLTLALLGVLLLLNNFLLLGDFNILNLWPLALVIIGAQILLRGDFAPSWDSRVFGITRGSVESATLEMNCGEIDTRLRALPATNRERLIAGQFAAQARPTLKVQDVLAYLQLQRSYTPWLTFADWEIGLARDLPWRIIASAYLGDIHLDLADIIVESAYISTGMSDIRFTTPLEAFGDIHLCSTMGNIYVETPVGACAQIHIQGGRFVKRHINHNRYECDADGVYRARQGHEDLAKITIYLRNTFGDIYLI